ncbi:MAG TPA: isochorismatase family cysteine hydrolase [Microthrixaceae bacterium]|nr:isochorismatase family cysteine hydrolase [Microthrixaceae bacterium]
MTAVVDPRRAAVLVVDLQHDFLHPDGAYARAGVVAPALAEVPGRVVPLLDAARGAGVPVIFSQFTLVPGRDGEPLISDHLRALRPFLGRGDFAPGSPGQATLAELGEADAVVEKVAYSAFAHTRLDWWLRKVGVEQLVVCGIVTNGGVASTVRDAHVREFDVWVVGDGCAAFDADAHEATLRSLSTIAPVVSVADAVAGFAR